MDSTLHEALETLRRAGYEVTPDLGTNNWRLTYPPDGEGRARAQELVGKERLIELAEKATAECAPETEGDEVTETAELETPPTTTTSASYAPPIAELGQKRVGLFAKFAKMNFTTDKDGTPKVVFQFELAGREAIDMLPIGSLTDMLGQKPLLNIIDRQTRLMVEAQRDNERTGPGPEQATLDVNAATDPFSDGAEAAGGSEDEGGDGQADEDAEDAQAVIDDIVGGVDLAAKADTTAAEVAAADGAPDWENAKVELCDGEGNTLAETTVGGLKRAADELAVRRGATAGPGY